MIETLTPPVIAVATLVLKKAFEKTGEKLGEAVSTQATHLWQLIQHKPLPKTSAINQADQPIDFGQAVLEVESVATTDAELATSVNQLAASVQADPQLAQLIAAYVTELQQAPPTTIGNYTKLADTIQNLFQGNTFNAPVTFN